MLHYICCIVVQFVWCIVHDKAQNSVGGMCVRTHVYACAFCFCMCASALAKIFSACVFLYVYVCMHVCMDVRVCVSVYVS